MNWISMAQGACVAGLGGTLSQTYLGNWLPGYFVVVTGLLALAFAERYCRRQKVGWRDEWKS